MSFNPSIALSQAGIVHVVWNDNTTGGNEVMYVRSTDEGATYSTPINISNNLGISTFPRVLVGSDAVIHVAWRDTESGASEIFYARCRDYAANRSPVYPYVLVVTVR